MFSEQRENPEPGLVKMHHGEIELENSFQYLPLISVEFSSQKIGVCNNFNMIGG
jgi:hypothetical protein